LGQPAEVPQVVLDRIAAAASLEAQKVSKPVQMELAVQVGRPFQGTPQNESCVSEMRLDCVSEIRLDADWGRPIFDSL